MNLSIVVPAHNEEENIADVINRIESTIDIAHELIIVNDHSSDATADIVLSLMNEYPNLRMVDNLDPGCFANAVKTGIKNSKAKVVVPVMGDLCDDLSTIKLMFEKIQEGYDVVCGSRYIKGGSRLGGSRFKGFLSFAAGKTVRLFLGIPTSDIANAFKMYKKELFDYLVLESRGFEISMEIPLKAFCKGFKITEVPTVWRERTRGKSNFKVFKLIPRYLKLYIRAILERLK
jgi:dolichol-phosphate mannosyltransferase